MGKVTVHTCDGCQQLRNCINGRYCLMLGKYVEYYAARTRPCKSDNDG